TEGIVDPEPTYTVDYVCVPLTGPSVTGSLTVLAGATARSVEVPVGSTCTVTEPVDGLPALQDAAWTWDAPTFTVSPASPIEGEPVDRGTTVVVPVPGENAAEVTEPVVTVTNTVVRTPGGWTLSKTSDPVSGTQVAPGSEIEYTLTVTVAPGVPVHDIVVTD